MAAADTPASKKKKLDDDGPCALSAEKVAARNQRVGALMPHKEHVFFDQDDTGEWVLTSVLTQEVVRMGPGDWLIVYDDETGMAACVLPGEDDGEDKIQEVEELMRKQVYVFKENGIYVMERGMQGSESLEDLMVRSEELRVTLPMGATSAGLNLTAHIFEMPRAGGMRLFWPFKDVHTALKVETHGKIPSRWVNRVCGKWILTFEKLTGVGTLFIHGCHGNQSDKTMEGVPWPMRCLESMSGCTWALLLGLQRLAFADAQNGGMKDGGPKTAAQEVLRATLKSVGITFKITLAIDVVEKWHCYFPRPRLATWQKASLKVEDGKITSRSYAGLPGSRSRIRWRGPGGSSSRRL